jgi:hypothetical protein
VDRDNHQEVEEEVNVLEAVASLVYQSQVYGDEGQFDIEDMPDNLEDLWLAWSEVDRLRWAAQQLKTLVQLEMEKHVPDGSEVRLGDELWRWGTGGGWDATDPEGLVQHILGNAGPKAPRFIVAVFPKGIRVTGLDAYAMYLGVEPAALRRDFATYKGGTTRRLIPMPISRAPKRADNMEHGKVQ